MKFGSFVLAALTVLGAAPHAAMLDTVTPPAVPADLNVSSDESAFLIAHAAGSQNYVCLPTAAGGYAWVLFGPQATLFDDAGGQVITHFLSPAPYSLLPSPTWQHSRDSSVVWGSVLKMSSDANYVAPDAIPWLLLEASVVGDGPTGGDKMIVTRRIQRVNTVEGKAPTTGCAVTNDIGKRALVPYEADYYFYKKVGEPYSD